MLSDRRWPMRLHHVICLSILPLLFGCVSSTPAPAAHALGSVGHVPEGPLGNQGGEFFQVSLHADLPALRR